MGKNVTGGNSAGGLSNVFGGSRYEQNSAKYGPIDGEWNYVQKLQDMAYAPVEQGSGAGSLLLRQGLDQGIQQSNALAESARGVSPALAQRLAAMQQANMAQTGAQNSAMMGFQEQQQNQANKNNYLGMLGQQMHSIRGGQIEGEKANQAAFEGAQGRRADMMGKWMESSGQAMGAAAGMFGSDERLKKNVKPGGSDVSSFLDTLSPKAYEYKNPNTPVTGGGQHFGVMAQDLEKTKPGASMVKDTPQGKLVDAGQGMSVTLAALGELNERLKALEGQKMAHGGMAGYSDGGKVPGNPSFGGDDPRNDTVHAKLSPGEIVIPRSIIDHPNAPEMAKAFVDGILASKKKDSFADGGQAGWSERAGKTVGELANQYLVNPTAYHLKNIGNMGSQLSQGVGDFASGVGSGLGLEPSATTPQAPMAESAPQAPSQIQPSAPSAPSVPSFEMPQGPSGMGMMQSAIRNEAKAAGDLGNAQVDILQQKEKDLADITYRQEQARWNYDVENDNLMQSLKNETIDPQRYVNNMSTGQKVMTILGIFMGGFGAGGNNRALDMFNKAIDNDIQAQKDNLSNKQSFYKMNMEKYKNEVDATMMTKANMLTAVQNQIEIAQAKAQTPMAQARAQQMLAQLQMQKDQLGQQFAMTRAIQGGVRPEDVSRLPPEIQKRLAMMPDGKMHDVGSPEKSKDLNTFNQRHSSISDEIGNLRRLVESKGTYEALGAHNKLLQQKMDSIAIDSAKMFDPQSVARESEVAAFKNMLFEPGSLTTRNKTAIDTLNSYEKMLNDRASSHYNTLGVPGFTGMQKQGSQVERLDPKTGKTAIFDANTKQFIGYK